MKSLTDTEAKTILEGERVYGIREGNMPRFDAELAKLIKRASKIGCDLPTYEKLGYYDRPVLDERTNKPTGEFIRIVCIRVEGQAPKYNGWSLIAALAHMGEAGTIISAAPGCGGQIPARYRDSNPDCDHCGFNRYRKETFLVRHDGGDIKQVGRQCIRDFLGHESPDKIAQMANIVFAIAELADEAESDNWGSGGDRRIDAQTYLTFVAQAIRTCGWVPRSRADDLNPATADTAISMYAHGGILTERYGVRTIEAPTERDAKRGDAAYEWALAISDADCERSDYLHNLRVIARAERIPHKHVGVIASAIASYEKLQARKRRSGYERPPEETEHFGTIGERGLFRLRFLGSFEIHSELWGVSHLTRWVDAHGNPVVWFASSVRFITGKDGARHYPKKGGLYYIAARVKKHDVRDGKKITQLTRCALKPASDALSKVEKKERRDRKKRLAKANAARKAACGTTAKE